MAVSDLVVVLKIDDTGIVRFRDLMEELKQTNLILQTQQFRDKSKAIGKAELAISKETESEV